MTRRTFIYNPESNTSIKTPNQTKKSLLFVRERKSKKLNMKKEIQDFTLTQTHHKDIKSHIPRCQSIPLTPKSSTIFRYPKTPIEILKSKKLPKSSIIFTYPEFQKPKPLSKIHQLPANIPFVTQNPDTKTTPTPQRKPRKPKIQSFQKNSSPASTS